MDIYSSSVRAEYAFAYHNLRSARARAHRHTTEQLVGRGSAQKKILLHNHERRRISQTDHWRCCLETYVCNAGLYCLVKTVL